MWGLGCRPAPEGLHGGQSTRVLIYDLTCTEVGICSDNVLRMYRKRKFSLFYLQNVPSVCPCHDQRESIVRFCEQLGSMSESLLRGVWFHLECYGGRAYVSDMMPL